MSPLPLRRPVRGWAVYVCLPDGRPAWAGGVADSIPVAVQLLGEAVRALLPREQYTPGAWCGWLLDRVPDEALLLEFAARGTTADHDAVVGVIADPEAHADAPEA